MRHVPSAVILLTLFLGGCSYLGLISPSPKPVTETVRLDPLVGTRGQEVALFALGLIDTGYRFGGKNPEAGLDCSGMVSYVYENAAGVKLKGSAADMARQGRAVSNDTLRPGDLVFFNTRNRAYSHVGIFIGNDRFIHAPNSNGAVRTESLTKSWFATRFEEARTYFE
jgi:cell wall-associated NlpC family hydrolase